jgi:hypothetical protein
MDLSLSCGWLALFCLISAQAQTTTTKQTASASASFTYVSDDGCVQNEVSVFAHKTTMVAAVTPKTTAIVNFFRHRYDICEDSDLGPDVVTGTVTDFSGDLNRASLFSTISGTSALGSVVRVSFALVWQGKGAITRVTGRPQNTRAGASKVVRSENASRSAVVSGTIDGENISEMPNASLRTTQNTISR